MKWLLAVGLVGCAHAAATPIAPTTVGAGIAPLQFYVGDWTCRGTDESGKLSADYPEVQVKVAPAFANWITIDVFDHGKRVSGEFMGADAKGAYHHVWVDPEGGNGSLTSKGWEGDTLNLDEDHPPADQTVKTRMVLKKVDNDNYVHLYEEDAGAGFKALFTKTCHRTKA